MIGGISKTTVRLLPGMLLAGLVSLSVVFCAFAAEDDTQSAVSYIARTWEFGTGVVTATEQRTQLGGKVRLDGLDDGFYAGVNALVEPGEYVSFTAQSARQGVFAFAGAAVPVKKPAEDAQKNFFALRLHFADHFFLYLLLFCVRIRLTKRNTKDLPGGTTI